MFLDRPLRLRLNLPAELEREGTVSPSKPIPVTVIDLSENGLFAEVELAHDLQFGDRGRLLIPLPGQTPWTGAVTVRRLGRSLRSIPHARVENVTVSRQGVGLQFDPLPEGELQRLRTLLEALQEG